MSRDINKSHSFEGQPRTLLSDFGSNWSNAQWHRYYLHAGSSWLSFPWKHYLMVSFMAIYQAECPTGDISDRCPKLTPSTYNHLPPQYLIMSWRLDIIPTFLYHHHLLVCPVSFKLWRCGSKGSHSHKPLLLLTLQHSFSYWPLYRWEEGREL